MQSSAQQREAACWRNMQPANVEAGQAEAEKKGAMEEVVGGEKEATEGSSELTSIRGHKNRWRWGKKKKKTRLERSEPFCCTSGMLALVSSGSCCDEDGGWKAGEGGERRWMEGGGMRIESRVDGGGAGKGVSRENVVMPGQ